MAKRKPGSSSDGSASLNSKRPRNVDGDNNETDISQNPDFSFLSATQEAEVGIIERITLKNFMCHSKLDINFGPHVNFIIGRNGSGKSAVVTALVVGLGGKASITSRGSTIKGFIKAGKQSAEVVVRLRNTGPDAYKHDEYGDTIIVERKFTLDGSSVYRLKSANEHVISTKREELVHILDQFNIQVDNPVAILNQETSRNFLHSKSPHDKYKFFLKATQLEQISYDYDHVNQQREVTKEIIKQKQQTLPTLESEVLEWEQKFKALDAIHDLKDKVKRLKNELAWAFVVEKEKGLDLLLKEQRQEEARMPKFLQRAEESCNKLDICTEKYKKIQEDLKHLSDEKTLLSPQLEEAKRNLIQKKAALRATQMEAKKTETSLRNILKDKEQTLERIEEIRNSAQQDYEAERRAREEKINSLKEQIAYLKEQQQTTDHQREQYRCAATKYKDKVYHVETEERNIRTILDATQRQLQNLHAARHNRLKKFGIWIPNLLNRIQEENNRGSFHWCPRGPLGACFQLKDPKWVLSIESCLKGLIHAFCCNDHHDEKVLEQIFENECSEGKRPSIIVSKFKDRIHDVSAFKPGTKKYFTVLDILDTDDPVVANTLIDQRGVESIILIAENKEARNLMEREPPKNVKEAFTENGDQIYARPTFRYYSSSVDKAHFLTSSVEEDISSTEQELASSKVELKKLQEAKQNLLEEIRKNQREERKTEAELMKIGENIKKCSFEMKELQMIEDPAPVDVMTLEEEVAKFSEQIEQLQIQKDGLSKHVHQSRLELESAEAVCRQIDHSLRLIADRVDPLKDDLGNAQNEVELAKSHRKHYEAKLKEQEKKIYEKKRAVEQYKKEIEKDILKAQMICPERIMTRRTAQNIDSEINQINKQIKTEEKSRGNPEEIIRKYHETRDAFMKIKKEVSQLKKFVEHLDDVMFRRQNQYHTFRQCIAVRTKQVFIVLLSNRNYTGKMVFSHVKETLDISMQPVVIKGEGARDMRSLSGGERSFTTVCFILALWDTMESPFRCLDEFDVFMDMVNRRISMDMMMEEARTQLGRQFIFLTPQDMSHVVCSTLRIFRMPDPDRSHGSQAMLPYHQESQTQEDEED